jgi:16S rRNA (guanine1207-N2)-methyltransferase
MIPRERLACEQSFRPAHDALSAAGYPVAAEVGGTATMVVVNLTRSRVENLGAVARGLGALSPGGVLAVNGAKTDGVDSIARAVRDRMPTKGAFVKSHGRVFWMTRPDVLPEEVAIWEAAAAPRRNADGFVTAAGLFSPDHPDPGSIRLAGLLPGRLKGRVADLGAGWGWLAQAALAACPAIESIELYEAEARALDAARENVLDPRAAFLWADVTALGRDAGPCAAVISNPPFHEGRAAEPERGLAFIQAAARILKPSGELLIVANRQLPYEATIAELFAKSDRLWEDRNFKVIAASRPRRR